MVAVPVGRSSERLTGNGSPYLQTRCVIVRPHSSADSAVNGSFGVRLGGAIAAASSAARRRARLRRWTGRWPQTHRGPSRVAFAIHTQGQRKPYAWFGSAMSRHDRVCDDGADRFVTIEMVVVPAVTPTVSSIEPTPSWRRETQRIAAGNCPPRPHHNWQALRHRYRLLAQRPADTDAVVTGILLSQLYPGALTSVIVGPLDGVAGVDFSAYREILWAVDTAATYRWPTGLRRETTSVVKIDAPTESFAATLDAFVLRTSNRLPSVFVTSAVAAKSALYSPVISEVRASLESYHRARVTRQKDGFRWQSHVLANVTEYIQRRVPPEWKAALSGQPAFVCGAGPSLDVSGPVLARHANHAVVFSADSALRTLSRLGVAADFAVSIDVAKVPAKCLPEGVAAPRHIVLSAVSPPEWHAAVPTPSRTFISSAQLTLDWLALQGVRKTEVLATESCGSTALDLARYLGCAPIYLFGLDFAADPADPTRRHTASAEKSIYTNSGYDAGQSQPVVPGNYAEQIPSFIYGDWRALDERLAQWPTGLVHNVNDRGARLRNTTLIHPGAFDLSVATAGKLSRLAGLAAPTADVRLVEEIAGAIRSVGARIGASIPQLRTALAAGSADRVVAELRRLFADRSMGHVLGAYALKLMPNLLPPVNPDLALWETHINELEGLARQAQSLGH